MVETAIYSNTVLITTKKDYKKMSKLDELREAVYADRFDGRIEGIKEAFEEYKKAIEKPSLWQRIRDYFKKGGVINENK